jgi:hypothetical protein
MTFSQDTINSMSTQIRICGHNPNVVVENGRILVKITQPKDKNIGSCAERQGNVTNQGQIRRAF